MGQPTSFPSLDAVHQQLHTCRLCLDARHDIFPRAIFSGSKHAQMMLIGQAPGITEKEAGRPFNAGSGTRLFKWLVDAGIEENWFRNTQYMTSVTKCYPGREISGDRVPSKAEQALCRPYLDAEIQLVNPSVIFTVGRLSTELFFNHKFTLNEIIGTQKQVDNRWIIPLPHPSGASRWHQIHENQVLIERAVSLIKDHYERLFGIRST